MRSPAQIQASRDNGKQSKGPVTAQGKLRPGTRSAGGVTGRAPLDILLQTEDGDELRALRDSWYARFQPIDDPERNLVDQITACDWRTKRCAVVEAGFWRHEISRLAPELHKTYENVDDKTTVGTSFSSIDDNHGSVRNLTRYETSLSREMDRLLKRIQLLQSLRPQVLADIEIVESAPETPPVIDPEPPPAPEIAPEINVLHDNPPSEAPAAAPEPKSNLTPISGPADKGVWLWRHFPETKAS